MSDPGQSTNFANLEKAVLKASLDADFRKALFADPKQTIREAGVALPDDMRITLHEVDPKHLLLLVPPLAAPRPGPDSPAAAPAKQPPPGISPRNSSSTPVVGSFRALRRRTGG